MHFLVSPNLNVPYLWTTKGADLQKGNQIKIRKYHTGNTV